MATDNNYNEILEEVCEKLNSIDSIKELDMLDIKNSVETIESLLSDSQAKLNFQDIKEKLENIALQVDSCNETLLKDLFNDINELKEKSNDFGKHLENIQNIQNLSLTNAEFEEFQKQQLDLALKTNENIFNELKQIKEASKPVDNTENIENLDKKLTDLHITLSGYIEQLMTKIEASEPTIPSLDEISGVIADVSSISHKSIKDTNNFIKTLESNFNNFKNKEFSQQLSKMSEIYDSLSMIQAWIEKVGFLNKSIENVYARLGSNIDFDDVSEKVDIIYENITALNDWSMKIDNIDGNMANFQSKIASLASLSNETIVITKTLNNIKNKLDAAFTDDVDFEDVANKMDIIYENLTAFNEWAIKLDSMSKDFSSIKDSTIEFEEIAPKIDIIYDNISLLNDWVQKIDNVTEQNKALESKFVDTNDKFNTKIDEISEAISNSSKIIENVPDIKNELERLSNELSLITRSTKNDTESYIYTLLDIETDFLKLHQVLEENTQTTSDVVNSLKERFEELNDDIASISKRTNKLILSADDANKEFRIHLESFKNTINDLETKRQSFDPETKYKNITEKLSNLNVLLQNSVNAGKNLNEAFMYLAEWIDATGGILNSMLFDVEIIKTQTADNKNISEELKEFKSSIIQLINSSENLADSLNNYKNEDISEIKSLLTGIIVQLNTALTPNIDTINDKIEKLSEENNNKFTELETLLKEKVEIQSKQINALEEKVDSLYGRIDKLIETISENHRNDEVKDILNYITTQVSTTNETLLGRNSTEEINKISSEQANAMTALREVLTSQSNIAEKLASFDDSVKKIVSYIEE